VRLEPGFGPDALHARVAAREGRASACRNYV
jgi:hypothetical protein